MPLIRTRQRAALRPSARLVLAGLIVAGLAGAAQPRGDEVSADRLREIEADVDATRTRLENQRADAARLSREMKEIRQRSVEAAFEVQKREARLTRIEARFQELLVEENAVLDRLKDRRAALVSVLAALQSMERNKPPALLVQPDDAVNAARSAMLLGSVVPDIHAQAQALGQELDALTDVRAKIETERDVLRRASDDLVREQEDLAQLLIEKQTLQKVLRQAAKQEERRLSNLADQARDLRGLIDELARRGAGVQPVLRPSGPRGRPGPAAEPVVPKIDLATAKGRLRPPVAGRIVRRFGAEDENGGQAEGLVFATRPGAQIVAPYDSRIAFAQPYRNYGHVVILAAGPDYHFVLTGLTQIYGVVGQELLAGEPIGAMGAAPDPAQTQAPAGPVARSVAMAVAGASAAGGAGLSRSTPGPTLYFELRRNGDPIDPLPWLSGYTRSVGG